MTPIDYVAPVQIEAAALSAESAADELEWLQLESEHVLIGGYFVPKPTHEITVRNHLARFSWHVRGEAPATYDIPEWRNVGIGKTKQHPRAYKVPK